MPIAIRAAEPSDALQIYQLMRDLAEYERALEEVKCSASQFSESLFNAHPVAYALVAEEQGQVVGFAIYFYTYSTWLGAKALYLEDLYVTPASRGKGAGLRLMQGLAGIARDSQCCRFEWSVLDWNTPSIRFYEALGAKAKHEWLGYRLEGEALASLAASAAKESA